MKSNSFLVLLILISSFTGAQTTVSGGIFSNTTWTKSNSPYIVVGAVAVFPGNRLTIEPGVEIRFDSTTYIDIRDSAGIIAKGTSLDSIVFRSNDAVPHPMDWKGIFIHSKYDSALFEYVLFKDAEYAITNSLRDGSIRNCTFKRNVHGIDAPGEILIDSCVFIENEIGVVIGPYTRIVGCTFINNRYGIEDFGAGEGSVVRNSMFCNNSAATRFVDTNINNVYVLNELAISYSKVCNNNILFLNDIGIKLRVGDSISANNVFKNKVGVTITSWNSKNLLSNNNICQNDYNINLETSSNVSISNICFCSNDSLNIANTILDGRVDVTKGLFNYTPWTNCDTNVLPLPPDTNCRTPIDSTPRVGIMRGKKIDDELLIYPNPSTNEITVNLPKDLNLVENITILNIQGQIISEFSSFQGINPVKIDLTGIPSGIYLLILKDNSSYNSRKFIIRR